MFEGTPLVMVESTEALVEMVARLRTYKVIGVDTESDSFHHYQEKVCLIQLSDLEQDYIVDPLKVDDMSSLGELMADPDVVKIFHGADYDVVCLKRDFGYDFCNIFDTMISAMFLGMPKIGLADLIKHYFGVYIDKKYQRHDWAKRPLLEEHLDYARGDTHWLAAIRELLIRRLEEDGRHDAVAEECAILEKREWKGRGDHSAAFLRMKGIGTLDESTLKVLRALWEYRDGQAKKLDRPSFKVLPDHFLISVAERAPQNEAELGSTAKKGSSMVRRHGHHLLEAVQAGLIDEREIPKPPKTKRERSRSGGPGIDRFLGPLKVWRNEQVSSRGVAPIAVVSNSLLKEIARLAPKDLDALAAVPGIRQWQLADLGEALLAVITSVPEGGGPPSRRRRRRRRSPGSDTESSSSD
jgi:ribonuclease D